MHSSFAYINVAGLDGKHRSTHRVSMKMCTRKRQCRQHTDAVGSVSMETGRLDMGDSHNICRMDIRRQALAGIMSLLLWAAFFVRSHARAGRLDADGRQFASSTA